MLIPAVRSIATYVGVSLYVLIVAPPGMLLAILFGWKDVLYVLGHVGVRLGLALSGIRVRVAGAQNVPHDRAAVFCSNHQSNVDPPILFDALHPRMHILYKAEIDAIPILARSFRLGGFIPIDRRNKEAALRAIETGAASIRTGNSFLIFPEGTRSRTADLLPFKKGAGRARRHAQGQFDHPAGHRQHPRGGTDRNGRARARESRRVDHKDSSADRGPARRGSDIDSKRVPERPSK
ncbi:MAG: hypothetical protein DMF98_11205 [Acidobacteria bacterium]|nr:MAG: hypothetical protein DMF98_11205 [Acidobacteriota bacterium]